MAPIYDVFTIPISRVRDKVATLIDAEEGSKMLDVCTGTGKQAFAFGKRGYEVVGIDLSEEMLKVAKRKNKYKNVRFEMVDAANMPFEDSYFDVSCISFGLHDMPHEIRERVLGEMKRVSRRIVIVDYNTPKNRLHRFFHELIVPLYESKYYKDFIKRNLKELLQQHNLRVIKEVYGLIDFFKVFICENVS